MQYGILGEKLGHSFSPQIHKALAGYQYDLCPVPKDQLDSFMKSRDFCGLNVTIPYKKAVMPYCDYITDKAKRIGSVNTLYFDGEKLCGDNTDYDGFLSLTQYAKIDFSGKRVIILGSGGTSLTVQTVAKDLGASDIVVISRSGDATYDDIPKYSDWDIIVNTTPVGMFPDNDSTPIDLSVFDNLDGVIDVVYNPLKTRLVLQAEERGIKTAGGLYMLVSQAKAAAQIFLNSSIPDDRLNEVFDDIRRSVTNITLIGMPGCGKSSIAAKLSEKTGYPVIDTDSEIVKESGMSIEDIFRDYGEQHFRDLESGIIKKFAAKGGNIISTGGGSILREENRASLRQNSRIYFIDRQLDALQTKNGRPLSQSRADIERLYNARIDIYRELCDKQIDNNGDMEITVQQIISDFWGK